MANFFCSPEKLTLSDLDPFNDFQLTYTVCLISTNNHTLMTIKKAHDVKVRLSLATNKKFPFIWKISLYTCYHVLSFSIGKNTMLSQIFSLSIFVAGVIRLHLRGVPPTVDDQWLPSLRYWFLQLHAANRREEIYLISSFCACIHVQGDQASVICIFIVVIVSQIVT